MLERSPLELERAPERFEDFYVREYSALVGLAYALSGSRSGAEDLAQEAFLAAYSDWDRIAGTSGRVHGCVGLSRIAPSRLSDARQLRRRPSRGRHSEIGRSSPISVRVTQTSGTPFDHYRGGSHRCSPCSTSKICRSPM